MAVVAVMATVLLLGIRESARINTVFGGDALDHQGNVELLPNARDGAPVERRLEFASGRPPAAGHDMALGEVALAPAVDRGVDGEAEPHIAVGDGAGDVIVDPGLVSAHIELEY